jgi:hypothetical protein
MGRRGRRREGGALAAGHLAAPAQTYRDDEGNELELRGVLTLAARAQYAGVLSGGHHQDDAWQRATEWLFERLAVTWTIHGLQLTQQKQLLGRYRMAGAAERQFVRESIRTHLEEHFPDIQAP